MKKIYLVGDACAGKTTFLRSFRDSRFKIVEEKGMNKIPREIAQNKLLSLLWFNLYYYDRDFNLKTDKILLSEYPFVFQIPYTIANYKAKQLTKKEKELAVSLTEMMTQKFVIDQEDLVIHLVLDNKLMRQRFLTRKKNQPKNKEIYWNALRRETEKYFKDQCHYIKIDTTDLSIKEVKEILKKIFDEYAK